MSYHICFPLLQWPGINKKMQCSKQLCSSAFLYLQLLVNCDLIQAEIREATDGCEIRSCFWQTDMNTMQKGGHHPTHCATVWLFGAGVYEPPVFQRGYAEPQMKWMMPDCSFAWIILLLLMVLEAGTFIVSLLTNAFFKLSLIFNTPRIKFFMLYHKIPYTF